MTVFSLNKIAQIVEGKLFAPPGFQKKNIEQIVTDSRTFFKGENALFFALKGPRNNGHSYIPELLQKGLTAFVVSQPEVISEKALFILVENTTDALQKLAAHHRGSFHFPVIGITGSNGKTIVKEWLHELLSEEFSIVRSPKSYNSQIGVPLSVLLMDSHFNLGIFEAGISHPGEMEKLAAIIQPEMGILTNIGDAHQENFSSKQQKTEEKLKLFQNAQKLIFCADDEKTAALTKVFCKLHNIEPVSWTLENREANIQIKKTTENGSTQLEAGSAKVLQFHIPFTDTSSIENACHCFAVASDSLKKSEQNNSPF
jgi:Alr-MurF fusion protein